MPVATANFYIVSMLSKPYTILTIHPDTLSVVHTAVLYDPTATHGCRIAKVPWMIRGLRIFVRRFLKMAGPHTTRH